MEGENLVFIDKETGDFIEHGAPSDLQFPSASRAISLVETSVFSFSSTPSNSGIFGVAEYAVDNLVDTKSRASGFENVTSESPCPRKPRVLAPTHFYVSTPSFDTLRNKIFECLSARPELVFSEYRRKYLWKCKYLEGSQSREMNISCFWDVTKKDHILEVKRVHGDGLFPQYSDLVTVLKQAFDVKIPSAKLSRCAGAVGHPFRDGSTEATCPKDCIQLVSDMARNSFYEPRLEAAKMLCDIISKQAAEKLESPAVLPLILEILVLFLHDQFEHVVEFGVVGLHSLLQKSILAREAVLQYKQGVMASCLLAHIRNADCDAITGEDDFYLFGQMRRLAGVSLNAIVATVCVDIPCESRRRCISSILQQAGFFSKRDWEEYVSTLSDSVLRQSMKSVHTCYC